MMSAIRTRLRCGSPLSNLNKLTIMFDTLELQNLNKLIKSEIGDFASPEAFHRIKVQRLGSNKVEPLTQVGRRFVVPISALVSDLTIKPCQFPDGTPPIIRVSFDLSTDSFVEFAELVQGVFQGLRMVEFLTRIQSQIGLHAEVYPYAFTCSGEDFFGGAICYNIEVECSDSIPTNLNIPDVSFIVAMMMIQDISADKHKLLFLCVPFLERETDTAFSEFVACLELRRAVFATFLKLRGSDTSTTSTLLDPIKETSISDMDTDNHLVKGISWNPCPVLMGALEQLRQVRLQPIPTRIFPIDTVIPLFQSKEVVMHIAQVIEHVAHAHILRMFAYLVFLCSHGVTSHQPLTPVKWVGRHVALQLRLTCLPTGM